jgi:hypothetical protein
MKKIFWGLFLLILASCKSSSPIEAFDVGENCPHVCWLGINPGVTTATEATAIINKSNQVRQKSIIEDKTGIQAEWFAGTSFPNRIGIYFENDLVKQIYVSNVHPLSVGDLIEFLGEPDEIGININKVSDATYAEYILFYSSQQSAIFASTINNNGPNATDGIYILILTDELNRQESPKRFIEKYQIRQPWLGFGHLKDYFPGQDIPLLGSSAVGPTPP